MLTYADIPVTIKKLVEVVSAGSMAEPDGAKDIQMSEIVDNAEGAEIVHTVPVLVKTGFSDERAVEVELGRRVTTLLEIIASERGCAVEELVLFREGEDELLTEGVLVEAGYPHRRRHHVHYVGEVNVTVHYQASAHHRDFKRHATVEDVLRWAIDVFTIDPSMATEFELARHGQKEELPATEHVGHLAGCQNELVVDLVRGDIVNGGCR
ncbi:hypothetical protein [Acidithiobacillus ferriphilus]|uniref:hypothetical protein n=1 Tax=Acidithiobacillus ferriphilus TaxID=1689834 RepID=UPI001C073B28|nr:hypothetical protein [Acidithiobacillus ferriphilus]MBU2829760.1 hypothetical protein [Acidithiobacillus ferriphilus]